MDWRILVNFIRQSILKLPTHSGFHDLFLNYTVGKVLKSNRQIVETEAKSIIV